MTASIERNVYVLRRELPNPIHYVRSTNAISLIFHFRDIEIPSGATAQVYVRKPSGKEVYNTAVISGSDVTVDITTQMFIEAGKNILQVQINQGEENLVTFEQPVIVHENYTEGDAEQSENESTLLQQYVDEVAKAAEDAKNEVQNEVANGKNDLDDYVEALKETIPADYTELSESVEQLERNKAPAIIEEASGTEITLDDSGPAPVKDLQLYGYSRQTQTTGAQLLDYSTLSGAQNGITPSIDDENYIVLNGTATANAFIYVLCNIPSGTSMFISVNNPVLNNNISVYIRDEDSTYSSEYIALDSTNKTNAFAAASVTISRFVIRVVQGATLTNFRLRPMLNAGTSALPWEPYSGGVASPSPDWAQPIHSVADEVNLLELSDSVSDTAGGITVKSNGDGTYSYVGTANAVAINVWLAGSNSNETPILTLKEGSYYAPRSESLLYSGGNILNGSNDVITVPDGGVDITGVRAPSAIVGTSYNKTIYPMLNVGSTPLPWRPYGHNVTVESVGANLIDASKRTINETSNGITVKSLGDGTFSYSGTATNDNVNIWLAGGYSQTAEVTHLRKGEYSAPRSESLYYNDETYLNANDRISVSQNGQSVTGARAPSAVTGTYYNKIIYPMISRGSSAIPWQPYAAPSSALIALTDSLRGIPVGSGGTYTDESGQQWIADYVYRRQTDGKWMIWRNCGRVEYIGGDGENWIYQNNYLRFTTPSRVSNALVVDGRSMVICNRGLYHQHGDGNGYAFIAGGPQFYYSPDPSIDSVDSFKTWLKSNPLEVVYQLATPTVEELPENVQTELSGLYTYNLRTDMWNSDNAHMALKYVADTKSYIDKKISEISKAITERLN